MSERVVLVTGGSGGIGLATCEELVRRGCRVRLVGRNPQKLEAALDRVRGLGGDAVGFRADFSSLDDVRRLAAELLERDEPLHVLINNAGVWHTHFQLSEDGFEDTFAVNHLAPFLLTRLLLPRMRESEDARVVHVSSRLHRQAGQTTSVRGRAANLLNVMGIEAGGSRACFDFERLDRRAGFRGLEAYAQSKLAQVLFSNELARRESEVTSNALHPGSVPATGVTRDNAVLTALAPLAKAFLKSPAQGARTSVHVACDESVRGVTGRYFVNAREVRPADVANDRDVARRLWELSCERTGLDVSG